METRAAQHEFDFAKHEFLLQTNYESLYSYLGNSDHNALTFECRGCGAYVPRWKRRQHFKLHLRQRQRWLDQRAEDAKEARRQNIARAREALRLRREQGDDDDE